MRGICISNSKTKIILKNFRSYEILGLHPALMVILLMLGYEICENKNNNYK